MRITDKYFYISLVLFGVILVTCKKDSVVEREYPRVNTLEVRGISENGATFEGDVYATGSEDIIDHGFVWGTNNDGLSIENSDRVSLGTFSETGKYYAQIQSTLQVEKKYFVRSFVKTSTHTVYGPVVSFISQGSKPPIITFFEPKTATWGDTITIHGKNFSFVKSFNLVYIGECKIETVLSNDTIIKSTITQLVNETKNIISIEVAGNKTSFTQDTFILLPPFIINYFDPKIASWGEVITIHGNNFNKSTSNEILFNDKIAQISNITNTQISVKIPNDLLTKKSTLFYKMGSFKGSAQEQFSLKDPTISNISKISGQSGSSIIITGNYFNPGLTEILFGNIQVTPFYVNPTTIHTLIPETQSGLYKIKVKIGDLIGEYNGDFEIANPKIKDFFPKTATFGDTITIVGEYFNFDPQNDYVDKGEVIYFSKDTIKFTLNYYDGGNSYRIGVNLGDKMFYTQENFTLLPPIIKEIVPSTGGPKQEIKIIGNNFNPIHYNNTITIGPNNCIIKSCNKNEITIDLALCAQGLYPINLSMNNYTVNSPQNYTCSFSSPWSYIPTPFSESPNKAEAINNIAYFYIESYQGASIYSFNPSNQEWNNYKFPDITSFGASLFSINNKLFVLFSNESSFKSWEPNNNNWENLKDFPGKYRSWARSFTSNGKCYIYGGNSYYYGELNDFWEYNPTFNTWTEKVSPNFYSANFFTYNNCGYVIAYYNNAYQLLKYESTNDSWTPISTFPGESRNGALSFIIGDNLYFGLGESYSFSPLSDFWNYNFKTNTWTTINTDPLLARMFPIYFTIGNKGYMGFGNYSKSDFYEFDSSLL